MSFSMSQELLSARQRLETGLSSARSGAIFSQSKEHRFLLWRHWGKENNLILFVGLNPSTADENLDDPTIRRCKAFALAWGGSGILVANLFAYRATYPQDLYRAKDPVGSDNDLWIQIATDRAVRTIACWGNHGKWLGRADAVAHKLNDPHCLRLTKGGEPAHPLYLPKTLVPSTFQARIRGQVR